jgi:hypothetical protein
MPMYYIEVPELWYGHYQVEADSEEIALEEIRQHQHMPHDTTHSMCLEDGEIVVPCWEIREVDENGEEVE